MSEKEHFTIVVAGAMNHAIHHPFWYERNGLISDEEVQSALKHPNTIFTPAPASISQFSTGEISIFCQESRWEIKAPERKSLPRLMDITSRLFDTLLPHTPVQACGFNFVLFRDVGTPSGKLLARVLSETPAAVPMSCASVEVRFRGEPSGNRTVSIAIAESSPKSSSLRFNANVHHVFFAEETGVPFLLKPTIDTLPSALSEVETQIEVVTNQLKKHAD